MEIFRFDGFFLIKLENNKKKFELQNVSKITKTIIFISPLLLYFLLYYSLYFLLFLSFCLFYYTPVESNFSCYDNACCLV